MNICPNHNLERPSVPEEARNPGEILMKIYPDLNLEKPSFPKIDATLVCLNVNYYVLGPIVTRTHGGHKNHVCLTSPLMYTHHVWL